VSGAKVDRKELSKLVKSIVSGDQVVVTRIDRLARSTFELFAIVKKIIDAGGHFQSLAEPWGRKSGGGEETLSHEPSPTILLGSLAKAKDCIPHPATCSMVEVLP
jgi:hypothetical protein